MEPNIESASKINTLQIRLSKAEEEFGVESAPVADILHEFADYLRANNIRLLDAANMRARAKVIKERIEYIQEESRGQELKSQSNVTDYDSEIPTAKNVLVGMKNCSFCAEEIKQEARLCRFCGKSVRGANAENWRKLISIGAISTLVVLGSAILFGWLPVNDGGDVKKTAIPKLFATSATISGGAFIVMQNGTSEILRGQKIFLCQNDLLDKVSHTNAFQRMPLLSLGEGSIDDYEFDVARQSLAQEISKSVIKMADADIEGKYKFTDVAPGKYCLFSETARSVSQYRKEWSLWFIPVQLESASITLDLHNSNMIVVSVHR